MTDTPAKAHLRDTVNRIKSSKTGYMTMTNKQLTYLRKTAIDWLEAHPDNDAALGKYDLLVAEIERRKRMGINI